MHNDSAQCPRCGGPTVPIVYGYPTYETFEAADRGELRLGGCVVFDGQPTEHCTACEADRGSRPRG